MSAIAYQITGVSIVYSRVCSDADQRLHQSSASLAFVRGIHLGPVNSPHKRPVTPKKFPFDDVIMAVCTALICHIYLIISFLLVSTDYRRLANFTVLVGENSNWRLNDHCYSQLPPVPKGATVEYPCEKLRLGHLVSINKTASADDGLFRMLMIHEVQVFGYISGMTTPVKISITT